MRTIWFCILSTTQNPGRSRALDVTSGISSLLLWVGVGTAVGCVIRGTPPAGGSRILFPVLCGILGLALLILQSASWMAFQSSGELQTRCRSLASRVWWAVLAVCAAVTAEACALEPHLLDSLQSDPWISLFAVVTLAGLMGARFCLAVGFDLGAFLSTVCLIACLLAGSSLAWCAPAFVLLAGFKLWSINSGVADSHRQTVVTAGN